MEGKPTYDSVSSEASKRGASESEDSDSDDEPEPRPAYTVDSYSAVATASMPSKPFHERQDDKTRGEQRP